MKRMIVSVGLAAVGAASVQGVYGQTGFAGDNSKPWSISAALRGFYDDNINTQSRDRVHALGYELNPSLSLGTMLDDQTRIAVEYAYSFKYYDHRPGGQEQKYDSMHTFNALLDHNFSERSRLAVSDSFVIGQEPDSLRLPNAPFSSIQRIPGDNIRNYGTIVYNGQITPKFGVEVGYANALFKYADETPISGTGFASNSGLLDRLEHTAHLDARWQIQPDTVGLIGYQYREIDYTGDQSIYAIPNPFFPAVQPPFLPASLMSDSRNSRSHYGYVGIEHAFRQDLHGTIHAGIRYTDWYNPPEATDTAPYVMANLRYAYTAGSSFEVGVTHDQNATDVFTVQGNSTTKAADSTVAYASINHRLLPNLYGGVIGTFQYSTFMGGSVDNQSEKFYQLGLNLEYRFNRNLSATVGYNFDKADSDVGGSYDRNRIYIGATASY